MGLPAGYGGESRFIAGSNAFFGVVSSSIPTVHGSTTHYDNTVTDRNDGGKYHNALFGV